MAEDRNGAIYIAIALGRPNTWLRDERADAAVFVSSDGGLSWDVAVQGVRGGIMAMCPATGSDDVFASTSEGEVLQVGGAGTRKIISGLPAITGLAPGA